MNFDAVPPEKICPVSRVRTARWRTEYEVTRALRSLGHEVLCLGLAGDLDVLRGTLTDFRPHLVFNLLEEFDGQAVLDQNVVSYLELRNMPYTGCGPRGMILSRDKALTKEILSYHGVATPRFAVFAPGRPIRKPAHLPWPLIVKPLNEQASMGIAQASYVTSDRRLVERVGFIHQHFQTSAIAETYIPGRELYVAVLGGRRPRVLPIRELSFKHMEPGVPCIATDRAKWSLPFQKKHGISSGPAGDLPRKMTARIAETCRCVWKALRLTGYARIDLRLTAEGRVYVLEANANPQLAQGEDFADAARAAGMDYPALCQRIVNIGLQSRRTQAGPTWTSTKEVFTSREELANHGALKA